MYDRRDVNSQGVVCCADVRTAVGSTAVVSHFEAYAGVIGARGVGRWGVHQFRQVSGRNALGERDVVAIELERAHCRQAGDDHRVQSIALDVVKPKVGVRKGAAAVLRHVYRAVRRSGRVVDTGDADRQGLVVQEAAVTGRDDEGLALVDADRVDLAGIGHIDVFALVCAAADQVEGAVGADFLQIVGDAAEGITAARYGIAKAIGQASALSVGRDQFAGLVGKGVCRCRVGQGNGGR